MPPASRIAQASSAVGPHAPRDRKPIYDVRVRRSFVLLALIVACARPAPPSSAPSPFAPSIPSESRSPAPSVVTSPDAALSSPLVLSVVGTTDLHGRIANLPLLAGFIANLRRVRAHDGAVVLLDAGDMFQGTLESNLNEGASVIAAYNALGYDAVAVGNHEFDFGPSGEAATPIRPDDDPRGALRARAREARFPLLLGNVLDAATSAHPAWENMPPSTLLEAAGVKVGVVGVTTMSTPFTTIAVNFRGLAMRPLADAIVTEARALRARGADVVLVAAHAGGECTDFSTPTDLASCRADAEIFEVARALPPGTVDAIVAGHTHRRVAHVVNGIPIVQAGAHGEAFGRVDLVIDRDSRRVTSVRVHPPQPLCLSQGASDCRPGDYEGAPVTSDPTVAAVIAPFLAAAQAKKAERLGPRLLAPMTASRGTESPLGNLVTDLMRKARPVADVAITNGGGLRADLPAGEITYGHLYEALPFDNRFALVRLRGRELRDLIARNLQGEGGVFSLSGVRVKARCRDGALQIELRRESGRPIRDDDRLTVVTSDFLAHGGDGVGFPPDQVVFETGPPLRDVIADVLRRLREPLDPARVHDPRRPRLEYPAPRPVRCGGPQ